MAELRTSFTFTPPAGWSAPTRDLTRWLAPAWTMLPLAARRCRVRNPLNGAVAELSADQYAVLTACDGCRTLEEHAAAVRHKLGVPAERVAAVSIWLKEFASGGLLTSLDDLARRFDPVPSRAPAPFAGIVIRTCDRPELLARALASAAALEARFRTRYRYRIVDDSRDTANRAANRRAVSGTALDCAYCDMSAEDALLHGLRQAFPAARDEIDWLLGAPAAGEATYGRPVNFALLLTAGHRVLMLDDDALLQPRWPPIRNSGFAVASNPDELFCFADQGDLERACAPADVDPIAAHLEMLGEPAGAVWARWTRDPPGLADVGLTKDDAVRFARDARILFTQNHAIGDPGSALFPYHLFSLPRASLEQCLRRPGWKDHSFSERHNWRGQLRLRLTPNRPLTFTTLAGLDNSNLLPPTVRAHRNEDLLLGEMTRWIYPGAWFVDLPWGLPHWRSPAKVWLDRLASFPQEPVHFLMDHLEQTLPAIASEQPQDRLRTLGSMLLDVAATSDERIVELLELQAADTASRVQFSINAQLDDADMSAEWKDALRPWLDSPTLSTQPATLRARLASPAVVRSLANDYGRALLAWPALWNWAFERAASGN